MAEFGPQAREEGLDSWIGGGGLVKQGGVGRSCSYCGSLDPDRFMELVRDGWIVGPTDKSYKAYLSRPLGEEEKAARKARWLSGFTASEVKAAAEDRGETLEQTQDALSATYDSQIAPAEGGGSEAKFYFQHLSDGQCGEFIELYNAKLMRVGYPGYFYARPFFCGTGPAATV